MKNTYCRGSNTDCARWMVASTLGKTYVPSDLFPSQTDKAKEILKAKR